MRRAALVAQMPRLYGRVARLPNAGEAPAMHLGIFGVLYLRS